MKISFMAKALPVFTRSKSTQILRKTPLNAYPATLPSTSIVFAMAAQIFKYHSED